MQTQHFVLLLHIHSFPSAVTAILSLCWRWWQTGTPLTFQKAGQGFMSVKFRWNRILDLTDTDPSTCFLNVLLLPLQKFLDNQGMMHRNIYDSWRSNEMSRSFEKHQLLLSIPVLFLITDHWLQQKIHDVSTDPVSPVDKSEAKQPPPKKETLNAAHFRLAGGATVSVSCPLSYLNTSNSLIKRKGHSVTSTASGDSG